MVGSLIWDMINVMMEIDDEGTGWGRPRPKFEDLLPDSDDDISSNGEVEKSMVVVDRQQNGGDDNHRSCKSY